jgi:phosphate starvation-inducible PhoH-like protein
LKGARNFLDLTEYKMKVEPKMAPRLMGNWDENLRLLEAELEVTISLRDNEIRLSGAADAVAQGAAILDIIYTQLQKGAQSGVVEVSYLIGLARENQLAQAAALNTEAIAVTARGKKIFPRTIGQKVYVDLVRQNGVTLGIGPAGTGKTYLAVALAVAALQAKAVNRLVLTRPAVEAGEKLGFLPGDLQEKVDPYLRPLFDGLYDILGVDLFQKYLERGIIEIAPLAYMRGRTLDDSFIILDEAQNTTPEQMKMFLTRLGLGSKVVVTGDVTQVDLPKGAVCGLVDAARVLDGISGIAITYLTVRDVVRHELVQKIIRAYEQAGEAKECREPLGGY